MARNRKYENVYQITLTGTTTNGFTSEIRHNMLMAFVDAMNSGAAPGNASVKVIKTVGDFDAITGEVK